MNLGDLIRQAAEGDFIEGVYNYCDRWCERCPLTSRCFLFQQERRSRSGGSGDPENQAFWDALAQSLQSAAAMMNAIAAERGIDLKLLQVPETDETAMQQKLLAEPLPRLAHEYAEIVDRWFQSATEDFDAKGEELRSIEAMEIDGADPVADADDLADCVEIVRWYQYQIVVKLMRAYSGVTQERRSQQASDVDLKDLREKLAQKSIPAAELEDFDEHFAGNDDSESDDFEWDDNINAESTPFDDDFAEDDGDEESELAEGDEPLSDNDPFAEVDGEEDPEFERAMRAAEESDANGSAKVALIAIDRSIAAWMRMRPHLPDRADELLDVLVMLDRLRRTTETQFPEARAFHRPGFDD